MVRCRILSCVTYECLSLMLMIIWSSNIVVSLLVITLADVNTIVHITKDFESKLLFLLELVLPMLALVALIGISSESEPTSISIVLLNTAISVVASVLLILDAFDITPIPFTPIEKLLRDHLSSAEFGSTKSLQFRIALIIYELIAHGLCGVLLLMNGLEYCEDWINDLHIDPREYEHLVAMDERARLEALALRVPVPRRRRERTALAA